MPHEQIVIQTCDGACPAHVFSPTGNGPWPASIFFMDAGGIRPASLEMAKRLADGGYVVLIPDLFYRYGPYKTIVPKEVFKGDVMAVLGPLMATTDNKKAAQDCGAFLSYLDTREDVAGNKIGAVGFCMGGGMALSAAATYPRRFAAAASFHGGNLATDSPTSPHHLVSRMAANVYIAAADGDELYPPAMAKKFEDTLTKFRVQYRADTYPGASHGWMKPDFPVYNVEAAERGWRELFAFYERNLSNTS